MSRSAQLSKASDVRHALMKTRHPPISCAPLSLYQAARARHRDATRIRLYPRSSVLTLAIGISPPLLYASGCGSMHVPRRACCTYPATDNVSGIPKREVVNKYNYHTQQCLEQDNLVATSPLRHPPLSRTHKLPLQTHHLLTTPQCPNSQTTNSSPSTSTAP